MADQTASFQLPRTHVEELSSAMVGFTVLDRSGALVGKVARINLSRTCMFVTTPGRFLRRGQTHAIHAIAVQEIDVDCFVITLTTTSDVISLAPELSEIGQESEDALALYYYDSLPSDASDQEP